MATPGMRVQPKYPGTEARAGKFPGPSLIPALNAIQARCGWLPREELVTLARDVRRPLYEISGLVSFYPHFRTTPPKAVQLAVCHDLACWLHGSDERIAETKARYGDDVEIEIVEVSCLGRCDIAPPRPWTTRRARRRREVVASARAGEHGEAPALDRTGESRPNDPYAVGEERYRMFRRALDGELGSDGHRDAEGSGAARHGRRRVPDRGKWDPVAEPREFLAQVHDLQRGRVRAGHLQGSRDPGGAAPPRPRGHDPRVLVAGSEDGWSSSATSTAARRRRSRGIDAPRAQGLLGVTSAAAAGGWR